MTMINNVQSKSFTVNDVTVGTIVTSDELSEITIKLDDNKVGGTNHITDTQYDGKTCSSSYHLIYWVSSSCRSKWLNALSAVSSCYRNRTGQIYGSGNYKTIALLVSGPRRWKEFWQTDRFWNDITFGCIRHFAQPALTQYPSGSEKTCDRAALIMVEGSNISRFCMGPGPSFQILDGFSLVSG